MSGDDNMNQVDYKKLYEELKAETRMRFEPPPETMEYIVRYELLGHYDQMKKNLKKHQETDEWCAIFSLDKEEDIRQIKKMIKAMKRVLDFYGAFDEEI